MNDVFTLLQNHRSIRQFRPDPVDAATLADIVRCGQHAATSSNIQACTVIQVEDRAQRNAIAQLAGDQEQVRSAAAFLVFCADLHRAEAICTRAETPFVAGMTEHFLIASIDAALFAQNCVIAAESIGLGTCYIGAVRNHPREISDLLHLPTQSYPVFGLCLGHPAQDPEVKPRLPLSVVLKREGYDESADAEGIAAYDATMHAYYAQRSSNAKNNSWSQEVAALVGREARPHMRAFLEEQGLNRR
ncbi:oxygen-insensitive NADPH nitroreductase [Acidithiobacillus sp. IBUN Pt1247-S3]|uniref:oxygen-insensitive NADPH nitroreductase n=1 Tax=Acidithiobacillus sp. IBUN Pt1247-S3 TaxID=3166642 RepID=UPI0034E527DC